LQAVSSWLLLYQTIRAPTCERRGVLAWAVIIPNEALVGVTLGALKVTRLVTLNDSNRSCRYLRSPSENFFSTERSRFLVGSARSLPNWVLKVRILLASCWLATVLKAEVLNVTPSGWCVWRFRSPP